MSGKDRQDGVARPVGDGNARVGGPADGRGDARNDLEGKPRRGQFRRLLPATPEQEGISSLESDDTLALSGELHQQRVGLLLPEGVTSRRFSGVDALGLDGRVGEKLRVGKVIVNDDIGAGEALAPTEGEKPRITGASPHEITDAGGLGLGFLAHEGSGLPRRDAATRDAASAGVAALASPHRKSEGSDWSGM